MFAHAATSPYDAFFTSGLLSASRTHFPYSSSTSPTSPDVPISPRRGSLPDNYPLYSPINEDDADYNDENDDVFNFYDGDAEDTMYFTLQPRARPSGENLRSFLSLDLAESQSMRSASLRRKPSSSTSRTNWSRSTLSRSQSKSTKAYSGLRFPQTIPELPSRFAALPQPPHSAPIASTSSSSVPPLPTQTSTSTSNTNLRLRFSRDSLRTIPSPKPAPCITLPEPPKSSRAGTPVSVHAPAAVISAMTTSIAPVHAAPASVPAPIRAPTPSTSGASTSFITQASESIASSSPSPSPSATRTHASTASKSQATKTKAPPRLPSLQPIPLELNIRMSALFASPPRPTASKPSAFAKSQPAVALSKAPSTASSRFISPAFRTLERSGNRAKNRESVVTTKTATTTRTVSTRARRFNRSEALARLEGRSPVSPGDPAPSAAPAPPSAAATTAAKLAMRISMTKNFMSMSDDESDEMDEEEDSGGEMVFLREVDEEEEDAEEDLDFDDGCSSSSSSSSGSGSSYVSLDASMPLPSEGNAAAPEGRDSGSSGSGGLSFPAALSLRGLVGRMAGLNPFMEAEDVVLPVQTPPTSQSSRPTPPSPLSPSSPVADDADVDIDDNFRFPAPPRTTAAERRLSLALSYGCSLDGEGDGASEDGDDGVSLFDARYLEAPRSAPLPPPPPPYSPFSQSSFYSQSSSSASPYSASPTSTGGHRQKKDKKTHLAVPGSSSQSSTLALPGLRRKRTKTRRGRDTEALVSFIDFPELDMPASAPPASLRIGERSDSLPEEMRELRRQQRRARYDTEKDKDKDEAAPKTKAGSNRSSKDSKASGSGSGSKSSSWTWRSFIEVANV